jgi:hypothetical protein
MGSGIQLPALHVNSPADPGEGFQRLLAMKGMLQQQAGQQQVQQQRAIEIQNAQMQQQDQIKLRGLFIKHQGDLDKVIQDAPQSGVSPQTIQQLQLHNVDVKTKTADLVSKQGVNAATQADLMAGAHDAVLNAPADQKPQEYQRQLQGLQQRGIDISQMPPQYPGDDQFQMLGAVVKGHKQLVDDAVKASEATKNANQGDEAAANAAKAKAALPGVVAEGRIKAAEADAIAQGGMTQPMADAKYRYLQQKLAAKTPISPEDQNFVKAYEKQKLLVPVASANIRMEGMGKIRQFPVYDNQTKQTVYMDSNEINDAKLTQPGRYVVPQFSPEAITQQQTGKTFAPGGKGGEEALAFQTAIQHADLLKKAAQALNNGDTRTLNSLKNTLATEFGDADLTNFNAIKHVYENEVQKMIAGSHITDAELKKNDASLPDNANFETTMKVLNSYQALAQSKLSLRQKQEQLGKEGKSMTSAGSQPEGANSKPAPGGFDWSKYPKVNQ